MAHRLHNIFDPATTTRNRPIARPGAPPPPPPPLPGGGPPLDDGGDDGPLLLNDSDDEEEEEDDAQGARRGTKPHEFGKGPNDNEDQMTANRDISADELRLRLRTFQNNELPGSDAATDEDEFISPSEVAKGDEVDKEEEDVEMPTAAQIMPPPPVPTTSSAQGLGPDLSQPLDASASVVDKEIITRHDYASLFQVLQAGSVNTKDLPRTVDTLKKHVKQILPILELRMKNVATTAGRLATRPEGRKDDKTFDETAEPLYFFDPYSVIKRILASDTRQKMHISMAHFVDNESQVWELRL
ncbi:unnamed protein product [Zymoseptoria tritici ST99CH_1A5]|uniref:Uncharacterized protein n=1 Tax=Zymoseptoria tritici ST99CH_1A5 TaxID=1276529 RepID=A0A1Y6LSD1_ZYMTR|nr:unnamed protein product [Zymoseptoria tritici ST99CH_1A5]